MTVTSPAGREQVPDVRPVGFRYLGLAEGLLTDYHEAWDLQRLVHAQVASGDLGPQVLDVDRGGKITYHGPGQLVGYPIVFLPRGIGVVDYVRRVEEALIRLLAGYGVATGRVPGRTGVWLAPDGERRERKVAAIGIRVSRQTTMHGFALNVASDLADFGRIVPCGIADADVTSLDAELGGSAPTLLEVGRDLEPYLSELLAFTRFELSADLERGETLPEPKITYGLTG